MKMGDIVILIENGMRFVATVLAVRELEDHSGKHGEPLLSVGFIAPVIRFTGTGKAEEKSVIGTQAQYEHAQFRLDVAHASHEFLQQENQKRHRNGYPGPRWIHCSVEAEVEDPKTPVDVSEDPQVIQ